MNAPRYCARRSWPMPISSTRASFSRRDSLLSAAARSAMHASAASTRWLRAWPSSRAHTARALLPTKDGRNFDSPAESFTCRASIRPMSSDSQEVSVELLRSLTPLEGMKRENLHALAKKVTLKEMTAGRTLFKEGDTDKRTIWVIKGLVELSEHSRTVGMVEGGSAEARAPLNQTVPRKVTARAVEDVSYLAIDSDL